MPSQTIKAIFMRPLLELYFTSDFHYGLPKRPMVLLLPFSRSEIFIGSLLFSNRFPVVHLRTELRTPPSSFFFKHRQLTPATELYKHCTNTSIKKVFGNDSTLRSPTKLWILFTEKKHENRKATFHHPGNRHNAPCPRECREYEEEEETHGSVTHGFVVGDDMSEY